MPRSQIVVYIASSLDGYIAAPDGGVDWLAPYPAEEFGHDEFVAGIATLVMGRTTYEQMLGFGPWPHAGKRAIVVTSRPLDPPPPEGVESWGDGMDGLGAELKAAKGDVWVVGGAMLIRGLLDRGLVDRLDLFVVPTLLGDGVPLFRPSRHSAILSLKQCQAYPGGVVRLIYRRA